MDIATAVIGFLKSALDTFLSVFNKKNDPKMQERKEAENEQKVIDSTSDALKKNDEEDIKNAVG